MNTVKEKQSPVKYMTNEQKEEVEVMSKHDFYFETPLYKKVQYSELEDVESLCTGDVDAYSAQNGIDTTYTISSKHIEGFTEWSPGNGHIEIANYSMVKLICKRKGDDALRFFVYENFKEQYFEKVGQDPSLADTRFADLGKKYDKVLSDEDLTNLKKAIGLSAHDAGAGAFVYLRRIFEHLIKTTFEEHRDTLSIKEGEFTTKHMDEKVELLKQYLPSELLEMKAIYSILSKGVHELTEDECRKYFAPLKLSIELILDQKIEEDIKKKRSEAVRKEVKNIQQELSSR